MTVHREPSNTRDRILQKATRLFLQYGYHGVSMREIAKDCGLSKAALYHHFDHKQEIFLTILNESLTHLETLTVEQATANTSGQKKIQALTYAIFKLPPRQRAAVRLGNQELAHLEPGVRLAFMERCRYNFIAKLEIIFEEAIQAKEFRPINPGSCTWMYLGYPVSFPSGIS